MKNKRKIIILTTLGIIPFYSENLFFFLNYKDDFNHLLEELSLLYGALIVSFLSGMQWQRIVQTNNDFKFLLLPMLPLLSVWLYISFFLNFYKELLIIICLIFSLFIDYKLINKNLQNWYLNLRVFATFMAVLSYFI